MDAKIDDQDKVPPDKITFELVEEEDSCEACELYLCSRNDTSIFDVILKLRNPQI
jgi:hypothetical protein